MQINPSLTLFIASCNTMKKDSRYKMNTKFEKTYHCRKMLFSVGCRKPVDRRHDDLSRQFVKSLCQHVKIARDNFRLHCIDLLTMGNVDYRVIGSGKVWFEMSIRFWQVYKHRSNLLKKIEANKLLLFADLMYLLIVQRIQHIRPFGI